MKVSLYLIAMIAVIPGIACAEGTSIKMVRDELIASCGDKMAKAEIKSLMRWTNRTVDTSGPIERISVYGKVRVSLNGQTEDGEFNVLLARTDPFEDYWLRINDEWYGGIGFKPWEHKALIEKFSCDAKKLGSSSNPSLKTMKYNLIFKGNSISNF